jgi:hypothetical protein
MKYASRVHFYSDGRIEGKVMPVSSTARSSIVEFPDGVMVTDIEDTHEHAKLVFDTVMSSPVCHF